MSIEIEALRQDPTSETAAAQFRETVRASGDLRLYVQVFAERGRLLTERGLGVAAAASYVEAAGVSEEFRDWLAAAELYRLAFLADAFQTDPLVQLRRVIGLSGQPDELVKIYRGLLDVKDEPPVRAHLHLDLADFLANEMKNPAAALEEIKAALAADADNPLTLSRTRKILMARGAGRLFVELLEGILKKRPPGSAPAIEEELAHLKDLLDPSATLQKLQKALLEKPEDTKVVDELVSLGPSVKDKSILTQTLEEAVKKANDPAARTHIRLRLAKVYDQADKPEDSVRLYAAVLDDDPRNAEARRMIVAREGPDPVGEDQWSADVEQKQIAELAKEKPRPSMIPAAPEAKVEAPETPLEAPPAPPEPAPAEQTISPTPAEGTWAPPPGAAPAIRPTQQLRLLLIAAAATVSLSFGALFALTDTFWPKVEVWSNPPGATIVIDDIAQPQTTPALIVVDPSRPHQIEVRYPHAKPVVFGKDIELRYLSTTRYRAELEMEKASVTVHILPIAGSVEVNGQHAGKGNFVEVHDLAPDAPVVMKVSAPGHQTLERSFAKASEIPPTLELILKPEPKK